MCLIHQPTFTRRPRFAPPARRNRARAGDFNSSRGENLLPVELVGHRRGTFNALGVISSDGTYGKETVLPENADRDEDSATQRDLDTATIDKANDDDLVKVVISFPANTKPAGVGLKLKHEGMKVDCTKITFDSAVVREGASRLITRVRCRISTKLPFRTPS